MRDYFLREDDVRAFVNGQLDDPPFPVKGEASRGDDDVAKKSDWKVEDGVLYKLSMTSASGTEGKCSVRKQPPN